jgi:hypothetical protein
MTSVILTPSDSPRAYDDILQTIGYTPLVHLQQLGRNLPCPTTAKVEFFTPGSSVKDHITVSPDPVQFSVSLENVDDLLNDLLEALGKRRTT